MNIAILSYEYPHETGFGGIGTYSYYHARALVKLGHTVHVFAGSTRIGVSPE
jgi:glycogen(starch) synthase